MTPWWVIAGAAAWLAVSFAAGVLIGRVIHAGNPSTEGGTWALAYSATAKAVATPAAVG